MAIANEIKIRKDFNLGSSGTVGAAGAAPALSPGFQSVQPVQPSVAYNLGIRQLWDLAVAAYNGTDKDVELP